MNLTPEQLQIVKSLIILDVKLISMETDPLKTSSSNLSDPNLPINSLSNSTSTPEDSTPNQSNQTRPAPNRFTSFPSQTVPDSGSPVIVQDHTTTVPSIIRRRASSVDMGRKLSPQAHFPHLSISTASVSTPTTLVTHAKEQPGKVHRSDTSSSVGSLNNHPGQCHYNPDSPALNSPSTIHSVIPPEVREYMLGNQLPISPLTPTHSSSCDPIAPTEPPTFAEATPMPSHISSASFPTSTLLSSQALQDSHQYASSSSDQPLVHSKAIHPEFDSSNQGFGPSSGVAHSAAPPYSHRPTKTPTSPLLPQQASIPNLGGTSAPPTETVYAAQPMTKRRMLTPTFLPFTHIKVANSHIRANDKSKEVISFSIAISVVIPPTSDPEGKGAKASWVVEKLYSDVLSLDHIVKSKHSKVQNRSLAQLPDRALFKDHAPSKVDARKAVLQKYLQSLCAAQLTEKSDVCEFFNSNIVVSERNSTSTRPGFMQGYLTKKGRNFGGWQTRFYVLEGPILEYFDTRGGNRLGHIVITGAQIGRQQQRSQETTDDSYRHAFLIRMHKREKEGEIDHILCAESDEERDAWVEALTCYVTGRYISADQPTAPSTSTHMNDIPRGDSSGNVHQTDTGSSKRQTSLDTTVRAESSHPHNSHHHSSSSTDHRPDARGRRTNSHSKVESMGHMSSASDGVIGRGPAPAVIEEHALTADVSIPSVEQTSKNDSYDGHRSMNANVDSKDRHRPPTLDSRHSTYHHPSNPPGPTTPRPVLNPRLNQSHSHSSPQQEQAASDADSIVTSAERPPTPESQQRPKISGPMNGAPITGGYRIKPPEEKKAKFRSAFWGFTGRNGVTDRKDSRELHNSVGSNQGTLFAPAPRPVFGVSLQEAVSVARVHEGLDLPAVVFRCVEFLEAKGAIEEEGIYRLSGSSVHIKAFKERFNTEGDYNLLESSKTEFHDVHAVAGLLKQFLRELVSPILTRDLHPEFLKVIDLTQRSDKVNELGRLCAELPLPNYTLLRFLSAHLIHIVQNEKVNKMSMRNVGIVFSPTLGMPAPLFALLLKEFDLVFNIEGDNRAPIRLPGTTEQPSLPLATDTSIKNKRMSRNSMLYSATGADVLMEHTKLPRDKAALEEESDSEVDYDSASDPDEDSSAPSKPTESATKRQAQNHNNETQRHQPHSRHLPNSPQNTPDSNPLRRRASAEGLSLRGQSPDPNQIIPSPTPSPNHLQQHHRLPNIRAHVSGHHALGVSRSPTARSKSPRPKTAGA
ncbi:uncharacterized protein MELLADRAFT_85394 [Melampsora larici-populina 98AG31]|uniref:RhoGAP-domain-containing protein n=1 Tax=Melampsora larici-populina (strain 98AG31 / pathotype 3-4-7) TaxID=747676 RepID=F4RII9_MELLP|nr:uncharacterized protein MELLADRAFT_85394 [Melampsora larici-populina 98AG31]EGG07573.1 hypothetical protein MELLADRAFT_85394 [Melampsora larici-populina 98AG31]